VWRGESDLPEGLASSAAASNGSRLVLAGGMNASGQPTRSAITRVGLAPPPPPPPPPAGETLVVQAEFTPRTLNLGSYGNWVSVKMSASDWDVTDINLATLSVAGVAADLSIAPKVDTCNGSPCMTVKLPRAGFAHLAEGDQTLPLVASTDGGDPVRGEAHVRVLGVNAKKKLARSLGPTLKPIRRGRTTSAFELHLDAPAQVRIEIVDVQGRVVVQLTNAPFAAGEHRVEWSGARRLQPGMYFVRARVGGVAVTRRIAVLH
jgi:hypothetical protein